MQKCNFILRAAILLPFFFFTAGGLQAQDDLLSLLGEEEPAREYVKNAFKSTRVIAGHSMEHVAPGVLDFRILHRFGPVNGGRYEAWGLDQATIRLGLDYGITDRLTVGIGRSSNRKELDGFIKYRLLWQSKGQDAVPVSVILLSGVSQNGLKWAYPDRENFYTSRLAFWHQMIIGRKFSEGFTFQLVPTVVHRNLVPTAADQHDTYAIGMGTRIKLTRSISLTGEYFYNLPGQLPETSRNPLAIGFDIETGGHVFQLHFTNSLGMNERALLIDTDGQWSDGDIHFGFNISRVFTLSKPKSFRK